MYSFAWVVYDILCSMKRERTSTHMQRPNNVLLQIGASIFEELLDRKVHLESIIASRENVLRCVRAEIERLAGQEAFHVTSYGSVSMYLCEEESDLDVCLTALDKAWRKLPQEGEFVLFTISIFGLNSVLDLIISYVLCLMSYVLCLVSCVLCLVSYVLCLMSYVLCLMSYVLCLMSYVLCLMTCVIYLMSYVLLFVSISLHSACSPNKLQ